MGRKRWRCYYCDDVFTSSAGASAHFGEIQGSLAACQIKGHEHHLLDKIREQERVLESYRSDDGQIMRAMQALRWESDQRVRHAEEDGYSRGLRDMRAIAEKQFGALVIVP